MPYIEKRKIGAPSRKKEIDTRRNNKWNIFYQDKRWKRLRQWQITHNPLCYDCMFEGRSTPATQVHHLIPFGTGETMEDKFRLLLNPDNLVSLCDACHDKRHAILNHTN